MKKYSELLYAICIFAMALCLEGCGKSGEDMANSITSDNPANAEEAKEALNSATTEWGMSREDVMSYMKDYSQVTGTGSDMLIFKAPNGNHNISYQFYGGALYATAIVMPASTEKLDPATMLDGYSYVGALGGGDVYSNTNKNTMATVWQPFETNENYTAIGLAPIISNAYSEALSSIGATTGEVSEVKALSATATGSVQGVEKDVEVGFIYSLNPNLSEDSGKKVSTNSMNTFNLELTGLIDDTTYYYRAYAVIDDIFYMGEVKTLTTKPLTYTINGKTYNFIKVEGGGMPAFSMMQTELHPQDVLVISEYNISEGYDYNKDRVLIKDEFIKFLNLLKAETGIQFRLPTRTEWEYAANGGNKSKGFTYSGSNAIGSVAWYADNSGNTAHASGEKEANELGFYDMSGNYAELCQNEADNDIYNVDGPLCGGNFKDAASDCKITSWKAGSRYGYVGDGSRVSEQNAVSCVRNCFRLVYTRE